MENNLAYKLNTTLSHQVTKKFLKVHQYINIAKMYLDVVMRLAKTEPLSPPNFNPEAAYVI